MKKLLIIALCLVTGISYAQDPNLSIGTISGSTGDVPLNIDEPVSFDVTVGNVGGDMELPPPNPAGGPFTFTVITTNIGMPVVTLQSGTNFYGPPVLVDLGNGQWSITMTQISPIPELEQTVFRITGKTEKTLDEGEGFNAGYAGSINAGGYAATNTGQDNPSSKKAIGNTVLPVTLVSFKATKEGASAQLAWSTSAETNSSHFDVQRSQDGKAWVKIGAVDSHRESTSLQKYTFRDSQPRNGSNLYRLKMVDMDGTFSYSHKTNLNFENLNNGDALQVAVYPNPSSDRIFLKEVDLSDVKRVTLVDLNGKTVYNSSQVTSNGISVSSLATGMYVLSITNRDGSSHNHKVLIRK